jgi:hypothetical protein
MRRRAMWWEAAHSSADDTAQTRPCEERSDVAIQGASRVAPGCFAALATTAGLEHRRDQLPEGVGAMADGVLLRRLEFGVSTIAT